MLKVSRSINRDCASQGKLYYSTIHDNHHFPFYFPFPPTLDRCDFLLRPPTAARHQAWLDGKLQGKDKSPTPDPNNRLSQSPSDEPDKIKEEGDSNNLAPPVPPTPPESPMLKFKQQWCELKGIDLKVMDEDLQIEAKFLKAWDARDT
jgi:hypothetical protein